MPLTTKEVGVSSFTEEISSLDRRSTYVENRAYANVLENNFTTPYTLNNKSSIINVPAGYSDGVLASLRPIQTFGPELVTNGTFDTDSDWNLSEGATISDGQLNLPNNLAAFQTGIPLNTEVKFVIQGNGTVGYRLGTGIGYTQITLPQTIYTTTHSVGGRVQFYNTSGSDVTIKSVSIKEVQEADFDFSRGSSATRVNEQGLVEDVTETDLPRINYTDGEGSLLLEPQSTNLITYSEDFSEWSLGANATLTFVSGIEAPDGSLGVYRLQLPATNDTFISSNSFAGQNPLALSIYAKSVNTNNDFNLYNGSASSPIKTATDKWQRFDYIGNGNQFYIVNSGDTFITDIYIWGAQAEALSYATSYIPTNGSTVTRLADVCNNSGNSDLINSTEGVLYAEISALANDGTYRQISINDGGTPNRVTLDFTPTNNEVRSFISLNGVSQALITGSVSSATDFVKAAVSYKQNEFKLFINGTQASIDTSGNTPTGLSQLNFDNGGGSNDFYGNVKCVAVFKEALTDEELAQITSVTQQEVFYAMRDRMNMKNYDYYEFDDYTTRLKKLF